MEPSCHQAACTMYAAWWCFLTFFCDLLYFLICISHQDAFTMCAAWWWICLIFFCDLLYFVFCILYLSWGCFHDVCGLVVNLFNILLWFVVFWIVYFVMFTRLFHISKWQHHCISHQDACRMCAAWWWIFERYSFRFVEVCIPHICHCFYTSKIFGE